MAVKVKGRKPKPVTHLLVLSDLHVGSKKAVCPPDFLCLDDGRDALTPEQEWLWYQWGRFMEWARHSLEGKAWALVVNGDVTEGTHHRIVDLMHHDPAVHSAAATKLLAPLVKMSDRQPFFTRGTRTHVGNSSEHFIGKALNAVHDPDLCPRDEGEAYHAKYGWVLRVASHVVSIRHHISVTQRTWTEGTAMTAALVNECENKRRSKHTVPTVICRAHRHVPAVQWTLSGTCVVTPAWQLMTDHTYKVVPDSVPHVGGMILNLDPAVPIVTPFVEAQPEGVIVNL